MFICYSVFKSYVIEKLCLCVLPSKTMLLSPYVPLLLCLQNLCHWKICLFVILSKTILLSPYVLLLPCLQIPCSSVSHKSLTPLGTPLCRRGAGGEAVPQERENQINTLVLKDINFAINIIYCLITERLIPWINLKNAPVAPLSRSRTCHKKCVLISFCLKPCSSVTMFL